MVAPVFYLHLANYRFVRNPQGITATGITD